LQLSTVDKHDGDEVAGLSLMNSLRLAFSAWAMRERSLEQQIAIVQRQNMDRVRAGMHLASDLAAPDGPPPAREAWRR
jgi:hypothetical protein